MADILGTDGDDSLTGTDGNDLIRGLSGNDTIRGGLGNDTIDGGPGADTLIDQDGINLFYVDDPLDVIFGSGRDTVITSVNFTLLGRYGEGYGLGIAVVRAAEGTAPINLRGGYGPETLIGNDGSNIIDGQTFSDYGRGPIMVGDTLIGLGGDDIYGVQNAYTIVIEAVGGGNDTIYAGVSYVLGTDSEIEVLSAATQSESNGYSLTGNQFAQTIIGDFGNNRLAGGGTAFGGTDILVGLMGDDLYIIDSASIQIREKAGEGFDTAIVTVDRFSLTAGAEVERIEATAGTAGIIDGNSFSQTIVGNDLANVLTTGGGTDTLIGGGGDDIYGVFSYNDQVIEGPDGGFDMIYTDSNYALNGGSFVEVLSTISHASDKSINLIGNFASQRIIGNYGNNVLNGNGGIDTLIGLYGDDTFVVGDANAQIIEQDGQGFDVAFASVSYSLGAGVSVEVLSAQTATDTYIINLTGNEFAQTIIGNAGANSLDGGLGADTLIGLNGADTFAFSTKLGNGNIDTIQDFQAGVDKIGLSSEIFSGLGSTFEAVELQLGVSATGSNAVVLYDSATGSLYYDADGAGSGAAVQFALITPGTELSAADFTIIPSPTTPTP